MFISRLVLGSLLKVVGLRVGKGWMSNLLYLLIMLNTFTFH